MKKTILFFSLLIFITPSFSQETEPDSLKQLDEVFIRAFEQNRKSRFATASVKIIEHNNADRYNKNSLVNGLNTIPGVRMEERSPGSYRINIRGSSLRSPFGVRNVKVYWNEIPVTDPGGNTYFNQFAYNNFSSIEIFKGPAGSMYGAGTGGLILINNFDRWQPGASLEYITGSYNLQNLFASSRFGTKENRNQLTYAHNQSDGYRVQTKMRRDNFSWQSQLKLSDKQQLTASVLFTDMYYQTPGALTLAEVNTDPKAARPAGGGFPSAVAAQAAIFQKNITAGFTNIYSINSSLKNSTTLYGAFAQIKNSAIRNYERRNEPGYGGRTVFIYNKKKESVYSGQKENSFQLVAGSEFQQGRFNTQVSKNRNGNPDTLQTNDDVDYTAYSFFLQGDVSIRENWFMSAGISLNKTKVDITRLSRYPVVSQSRSYRNELAPRFSIKKLVTEDFSLKATLSRGFSPPTVAELLPSTGVISTDLEAEYGWNYELTAGHSLLRNRLHLEATGFYFKLNKALVQRRDVSGADFFVNAGDVQQKGIELHADYTHSTALPAIIDYIILQIDYTYNHFRYGSFIKGTDDFSGKTVPSVPSNTLSGLLDINFKNGLYVNTTYYAASRIFLNDANTASASPYHLLSSRIGWKKALKKKYKINIYAGADNLLDEKYSLGNDINAAANRFYNAAPERNYYAGIAFQWIKVSKK
ncbi:MAG: TonB-dependent receptor [Chitinophagaceae bacterium]|nr:TonB-dependent receptor [Chitinophagaceae bacterium]